MKKTLLFSTLLILFFTSCGIKKIEISEETLMNKENKNISFTISENKNKLFYLQDGIKYEIRNIEKFGIKDNLLYSFFKNTINNINQILVVYNFDTNKYEYEIFFPETSFFFEEEFVCIINEKKPNTYPLPPIYEIKTTAIDFKTNTRKEDFYECRNWNSNNIKQYKDFYFQKPSFRKIQYFESDSKYYDIPFKKYLMNGPVYSCIWQQAHFPSFIYYFCEPSSETFFTTYYPQVNNNPEYKISTHELIPNQIQTSELTKLILSKNDIMCSNKTEKGESAVLLKENSKNKYENFFIAISNGKEKKEFCLGSIFEYQDELVNIETASEIDNKACFIVTTKEFSYDMFIDYTSFDIDIYLRASSFPEEERYFE